MTQCNTILIPGESSVKRGVFMTGKPGFDMKAYMFFQIEEMHKHKYLESEKAGKDLGSDALIDWVGKYAKDVRVWAESSGLFLKEDKDNK